MANPLTLSLEQRLVESVLAWLATPIASGNDPTGNLERARQLLASFEILLREEDRTITPEQDKEKRARVILNASDEGRAAAYTGIRTLRIVLAIRANSKVPAGQSSPFQAACGALEILLDGTNILTGWSSPSWQIGVMLAVRARSVGHRVEGDIRTASYGVEVKAIGLEHTGG